MEVGVSGVVHPSQVVENKVSQNFPAASGSAALQRAALARLLASPEFANSERLATLLRHLAEAALAGNPQPLKETVLGVEVFGRPADYDPKTDSVVRTEVRRLRLKLNEYYSGSGANEPIQIDVPKGAYQVVFQPRPTAPPVPEPANGTNPISRLSPLWLVPILLLPLGFVALSWFRRPPAMEAVEARLLTPSIGQASNPSVSADGQWIAYAYAHGAQSGIYLLGPTGEPRQIPGTRTRDFHPALSPDARHVAFLREESPTRFALLVQDVNEPSPQQWAVLSRRDRLCWLPDGQRLIASLRDVAGQPAHLRLVSSSGPGPILTSPAPGVLFDGYPALSPDGRQLAFLRATDDSVDEIHLLPLSSAGLPAGPTTQLTREKQHFTGFTFTPDGRSLIASLHRPRSARGLYRIPLADPLGAVRIAGAGASAAYPVMAPGSQRLIYSIGVDDINLYRFQPNAAPQPLSHSNALDSGPALSPDGQQVAFRSARSGYSEIWTLPLNGANPRRLTSHNGPTTGSPRWSPDGRWIAYDTRAEGNGDIHLVSADGQTNRRLTTATANEVVPTWSPDGRSLFYASDQTGTWQIWRLPLNDGQPAALPLQFTAAGGFRSAVSPDGQWLYYSKREPASGLWRMPLTGGAESPVLDLPVSLNGAWALSRTGVYFLRVNAQPQIFFQPFTAPATARLLHTLNNLPVYWESSLAVSPDDQTLVYGQLDRAVADLYEIQLARQP